MHPHIHFCLPIVFLATVLAHGQSVQVPPPATEPAVTLSAYVVTAEDEGWLAGNTMLANRTNQAIRNVPVTIESLTPDFMAEVGAFDAISAMEFIANATIEPEGPQASTVGTGGTPPEQNRYGFRGILNEGGPTRNLFSWDIPSDSYNIERIDVGRGSNSLLFGDVEAGGQANIYTKNALLGRNFGSVLAQVASFNSYRFNLDYNRVLSKQVAVRVNVTKSRSGRDFDFNHFDIEAAHGAVTYQPFKNTRLRAEGEIGNYGMNWGTNNQMIDTRMATGLAFNQRWTVLPDNTVVRNLDLPAADRARNSSVQVSLLDKDPGGFPRHYNWSPAQTNDRFFTTVSAFIEQRLGEVGLELAFNQQIYGREAKGTRMANLIRVDGMGRRYIDYTYQRTDAWQRSRTWRAMGTYEWKPLAWMSQYLVASAQWDHSERYTNNIREVNALDHPEINNNTARVWYRAYVDDPDVYTPAILTRRENPPQSSTFQVTKEYRIGGRGNYGDNEVYSFSAAGYYWDGRVRTLAGVRLDRGDGYNSDAWTAANRYPDGQAMKPGPYYDHPERFVPQSTLADINEVTKNFGLVYRVNKSVNAYASYGESFRAANGDAVDFSGQLLGQQRGATYEVGVKSEFRISDRRLVWNLNWFSLDRSNVEMTWPNGFLDAEEIEDLFNPDGLSTSSPDYVQVSGRKDQRQTYSKGYESTFIFYPGQGFNIRLSGSSQRVTQDAGLYRFRELLAAARARGGESPTLLAGADALIAAVGGDGQLIRGRPSSPVTFNFAVNYSVPKQHALSGLSVGLNGSFIDNYVLAYIADGSPVMGGRNFSLHGMIGFRHRLANRPFTYRLNVRNLNQNKYTAYGAVQLADGTIRKNLIYADPLTVMFTTTMDF